MTAPFLTLRITNALPERIVSAVVILARTVPHRDLTLEECLYDAGEQRT